MSNIIKLIDSGKSVYTLETGKLLFNTTNHFSIRNNFYKLKKSGAILNPVSGIYTLKKYEIGELANKLKVNSYISLETVLFRNGIIFQNYSSTITSISNKKYSRIVDRIDYQYFKIKDAVLHNPLGIDYIDNRYYIASAERAICDRLYLIPNYYFDHISANNINILKLEEISKIYNNQKLILEIKKIINDITKA